MKGSVAVIGSGVAGIVAAHELSKAGWETVLFEKNGRLGGHTSTVVLVSGPDEGAAVDTGFIVLNDRTYPNFHRFLAELGVGWRWSDMSFGYHDAESGLQYAGTDLAGLFAQPANALSPRFWGLIADFLRFNRRAPVDLDAGALGGATLGEYLGRLGVSRAFRDHYIVPMGAAIWSTALAGMLDFPAETFVRFFKNHGLLSVNDHARWQTVVGGSHAYLKAFRTRFPGEIALDAPVESLRRVSGGVEVAAKGRPARRFDRAVVAAHADEALALLADPSEDERRLLGAWTYLRNRTILHADESFLPPNRRARASWNYRREKGEDGAGAVSVTYDMNRLQGLTTARRYLVTLNPRVEPRAGTVVREFLYMHPGYDFRAIRSQAELPRLQGVRATWFCGSYFGYGFHEDAVVSALNAVRDLDRTPQEVA